MPLSYQRNLDGIVIDKLQSGPISTARLLEAVRKRRRGTTKQGMYRVLRKLVAGEVVVKHKLQVSLNVAWLAKLETFLSKAERSYIASGGSIMDLEDGDRVKYEFGSTNVAEAFWNHTNHVLVANHPKTPWFGYNPHCWFFLVDAERERGFRDFIKKNGGQYFIVSDGKTPLDRSIRDEFDDRSSQYHMRDTPLFDKDNYYLNVIGDYVIEAWLDPKHSRSIERVYVATVACTPEVKEELRAIITSKGRTKLTISHDKKKAERFRRLLAKPFHVRNLTK